MKPSAQQTASEEHDRRQDGKRQEGKLNRIIKRFGGRHLIFQTDVGNSWLVPTPYVLVSSFRGPMWAFYGAGQIWLTHKKLREVSGWMARVPRLGNRSIMAIFEKMESDIAKFTHFCNEHGIEGTVVLELKAIEFHWTFGDELSEESEKKENASLLDEQFKALCDRYLAVKAEVEPSH